MSQITIINLTLHHIDAIYDLMKNNYITDGITVTYYSHDFLRWYMNKIDEKYRIGLIYKNILIASVFCPIIEMNINNDVKKVAYLSFLCYNKKIVDIHHVLVQELVIRLNNIPIIRTDIVENSIQIDEYIVPVNTKFLNKIGFIDDTEFTILEEFEELHFLKKDECYFISNELNKYYASFALHINFNEDFVSNFLLPFKRIVYSFTKKNDAGIITDFVSVFVNRLRTENGEIIVNSLLGPYFVTEMSVELLLKSLIRKLYIHGIHQLIIKSFGDNAKINITKYGSDSFTNYILSDDEQINSLNFVMLPFN
jgi:hypothetical protein